MTPSLPPSGQKLTRKQLAQILGLPDNLLRRCTAIRLLPDGRIVFRSPLGEHSWKMAVYSRNSTE